MSRNRVVTLTKKLSAIAFSDMRLSPITRAVVPMIRCTELGRPVPLAVETHAKLSECATCHGPVIVEGEISVTELAEGVRNAVARSIYFGEESRVPVL